MNKKKLKAEKQCATFKACVCLGFSYATVPFAAKFYLSVVFDGNSVQIMQSSENPLTYTYKYMFCLN